MTNPLADDLGIVDRLARSAARARAEFEAAEPALARLDELHYPSAGLLRYDLSEAIGRCEEIAESITALRFGLEAAPLEQEGLAY